MDDPHYACAPLSEWLGALGTDAAMHAAGTIPRSLRGLVEPLPAVGPHDADKGVILVVGELPEDAAADLLSMLRPGGWVVELVSLPHGLARTLLTLRADGAQATAIGYRSVLRWSEAGVCGLVQWSSVDPADVLVTLGRRRA